MKQLFLLAIFTMTLGHINAQNVQGGNVNQYNNASMSLLNTDSKLLLGGYGEVHYNQPLDSDTRYNGTLDVHRVVMLLGYNFNERTQFISEIEFEHVTEVYVEQAFLQYKLNKSINLRGGLMLIPMGIINEYHEPTTFNGVERPIIDNTIAPTTWREIGVGVSGTILPASLKYQAYVINGFNGYNNGAVLNGSKGFRSGRQKGEESYISSPNFAGKVEYFGIRGLNLGLSGYFGKSQSKEYNGITKNDDMALASADSSAIGISMVGLDARYITGALQLRGQFYYANISNSNQYNAFSKSNTKKTNDLGSAMMGYYAEVGYNVLKTVDTDLKLMPFVRYEYLDTHQGVESLTAKNPAYQKDIVTTGLTLALSPGAVVKADMTFIKSGADDKAAKIFNAGVGFFF